MIGKKYGRKTIRFLLRDHLVNQNTHLVPKIENAEKPFFPVFMRFPELRQGIKNGDEGIRTHVRVLFFVLKPIFFKEKRCFMTGRHSWFFVDLMVFWQ